MSRGAQPTWNGDPDGTTSSCVDYEKRNARLVPPHARHSIRPGLGPKRLELGGDALGE